MSNQEPLSIMVLPPPPATHLISTSSFSCSSSSPHRSHSVQTSHSTLPHDGVTPPCSGLRSTPSLKYHGYTRALSGESQWSGVHHVTLWLQLFVIVVAAPFFILSLLEAQQIFYWLSIRTGPIRVLRWISGGAVLVSATPFDHTPQTTPFPIGEPICPLPLLSSCSLPLVAAGTAFLFLPCTSVCSGE